MTLAAAAPAEQRERFTLFESKLRPPSLRPGTVSRTTLVDRLSTGRRLPIVAIEAPAGYGKSTLAAEWARSDRRRFAWYSIDERDNDPLVFLSYVATALARCGAPVDRAAFPGTSAAHIEHVLRRALASLPEPVVFVLDGVELLASRACRSALASLLGQIPAGSQFVLLSRSGLAPLLERVRPVVPMLRL